MVAMSKRPREDDSERPPKRPKPEPSAEIDEIRSARQLQQLLTFRQDEINQLRDGIASFKVFLESILYQQDAGDREYKLSILKEFLDGQKPEHVTDTANPMLGQLWQAWSFANQEYNDALSSAVSAIFALLVKTLSSLLSFKELGYLVCRTVLQHQHLRLVKKCLDAPRQKEYLISPCVRLLTEIADFDGGVLARDMYKRREETFEIGMLRRNLSIVKTDISEEEAHRRPAIRTLTLRYILAHLKYLYEGGKADILKHRPLCTALFSHLLDDPADIIIELLSITEQHVFKDDNLPRSAKAALLSQQNLQRVTEIATQSVGGHAASARAIAWLRSVVATPPYGILRRSGWYPPGTAKDDLQNESNDTIDLGLDSLDFYDRGDRPDVRNTTLLGWILTLKPHSSEVERDLCLATFRAAPELVAAYFSALNVQLEPKLSNTWLGYASFLFEAISIPIPDHLGSENAWAPLPPQTNIVIENILPRPLTQKVLTRCLNQSSDLITFFAVKVLIVSFVKISKIIKQIAHGASMFHVHASLWKEASERLLSRFRDRCPRMKDVIATFRRIPEDDEHVLQREAITRLLRLYYEVMPHEAMEEQFDISSALTAALIYCQSDAEIIQIGAVRSLDLENLLEIARHSPSMRWFSKQGSLQYSPIVTLLRLHSHAVGNLHIRTLIGRVLHEGDVLSGEQQLDALVASTIGLSDVNVWAFIDDCIMRASRKPVKYLDDLQQLADQQNSSSEDSSSHTSQMCLIVAVLLEQATFVPGKGDHLAIMEWIGLFLRILSDVGPDSRHIVATVQSQLSDIAHWRHTKLNEASVQKMVSQTQGCRKSTEDSDLAQGTTEIGSVQIPFEAPPAESANHPELIKWARKDLEVAFDDGDIEALVLCLCSTHADVRTQALVQLNKVQETLRSSTLDDKEPFFVVLGELMETYEQHRLQSDSPLQYIAGTFATHALRVQSEPTHPLYPKLNRYLNKGPQWRISKLPIHWLENTVLSQPGEDDAYWTEVQWVLDWLVDGLRTPAELEIYRRTSVFEKVMSVYASPGAALNKQVRERVIELIWRCTCIPGGSTTLITRTGVLSWLDIVSRKGEVDVESTVRQRLIDTADKGKVEEWSAISTGSL